MILCKEELAADINPSVFRASRAAVMHTSPPSRGAPDRQSVPFKERQRPDDRERPSLADELISVG